MHSEPIALGAVEPVWPESPACQRTHSDSLGQVSIDDGLDVKRGKLGGNGWLFAGNAVFARQMLRRNLRGRNHWLNALGPAVWRVRARGGGPECGVSAAPDGWHRDFRR